MSFQQTNQSVKRLAGRIIAGEAVFFVGAGFSLDSEPNTSARLIRRLMARFAAMTEPGAKTKSAAELREGLRVTFGLGDKPLAPEDLVSRNVIDPLTQVYYNINDWVCNAFTILLHELRDADASQLRGIRESEARLLLATGSNGQPYDSVPLEPFDPTGLLKLDAGSGKALFLETMGFGKPEIFGGDPRLNSTQQVVDSYGARLRDRYLVIARLAREGLAPLMLTTNFDLLLEGACRAVGFEIGDATETDPQKPGAAFDRCLIVARPTEFFERGTAYRAALLLKIHGCVWHYRQERTATERLERYLPSMVFTYREIQNWRKDSWSRDMVSTLLRTRSIVLCGYSGADPVVHDTFRTVYEEILSNLPGGALADAPKNPVPPKHDTLSFFTGAAGKGEFAGLEILRAGSRAAGIPEPPLFGHRNYLSFHFLAKPDQSQPFPTLDELFVWIYHQTLRRMQLNAISSDLGRIAVTLLGRVAPADIQAIRREFLKHCARENLMAAKWDESERSRREFEAITAWTHRFHLALLREFALMEARARNQRSGRRVQEFRSPTYYFPLLDRPGWGAWGAVVELALLRMAGLERGRSSDGLPWYRSIGVGESVFPVALVKAQPGVFTRTAVVLRGPGAFRIPRSSLPGVYRRTHEWDLTAWTGGDGTARGTPATKDIWRWSFLSRAKLASQSPGVWFGESDETTTAGKAAIA